MPRPSLGYGLAVTDTSGSAAWPSRHATDVSRGRVTSLPPERAAGGTPPAALPVIGPRSADPGRVVILGAGPCGLACADELRRLGHDDHVLLEAGPVAGGLGRSVVDRAGFTWDLGGHVVFSQYGEFDRLLSGLFGPGELLHHDRSSYISFRDRWVPYPFQRNLYALPPGDAEACLRDLLAAVRSQGEPAPRDADFATWLERTYGTALVDRFFGPYNRKVWSTPPEEMSAVWVAGRVAPVREEDVLAQAAGSARDGRWGPNATFAFPRNGGTGEIWRRLAARNADRLRTGARVRAVDPDQRHVLLETGERLSYDHLVATGPLDALVAMTSAAPARVRAAARLLRRTTVAMVGLGYRAPTADPRSWLYFPQPDVPFYRATNFGRYAPSNVPGSDTGRYSAWMTEVSVLPGTPVDPGRLTAACDRAIRRHRLVPADAPLVSAHLEWIPHAYPIPTTGRDDALSVVVPWLESRNIHPRGRFGTWRYEIGNMDHAVKMGLDVARRLTDGTPEELLSNAGGPPRREVPA